MFCRNCGQKMDDNTNNCPRCGTAVNAVPPAASDLGFSPPPPQGAPPPPQDSQQPPQYYGAPPPQQPPPGGIPPPGFYPPPPNYPPPHSQDYGGQPPYYPPPQQQQQGYQPPYSPQGTGDSIPLDYGRAFTYVFEAPGWFGKCLILGLLSFIPIINILAYGYVIRVARQVRTGYDLPLPEIEFGTDFGNGFIYGLAFLLFTLILLLPLFILGSTLKIVFVIVYLFLGFYMTAAIAMAIVSENPWMVFSVGKVINAIRDNPVEIVIVALIISTILPMVACIGILGLLIGVLITIPLSKFMLAHLLGQLGRSIEMKTGL